MFPDGDLYLYPPPSYSCGSADQNSENPGPRASQGRCARCRRRRNSLCLSSSPPSVFGYEDTACFAFPSPQAPRPCAENMPWRCVTAWLHAVVVHGQTPNGRGTWLRLIWLHVYFKKKKTFHLARSIGGGDSTQGLCELLGH